MPKPLLLLALAVALAAPAAADAKTKAKARTVTYVGQLQDEAHNPIGGVYPLQFALYGPGNPSKPVWTETAWVAVDKGVYVVELGAKKKLPGKLRPEDLTIAVSLNGGAELVREPLSNVMAPEVAEPAAPAVTPQPARTPDPSPRSKGVVEYADRAGYSFEAEHASTADKLENMTLEELRKVLASKPTLGKTKKYTAQIGGQGGYEYTELCPEGYVVVGMTGAAGKFIDSMRLVCAPLE